MLYDINNRRFVGLYSIGGRVVLCSLLIIVTSSFTLQTTPMISASKKLSFARRNNSKIFISFSSPESDKSEEKVIREPSATISLSKDIKSSSNVEEEDVSNQLNFNSDTIISNIGVIVIILLIASLSLSLVGNVGGVIATELAREISNLFGILINITVAIGTAIFGMLKFILPVVGKGVADGVVAATPIVKDAAYSASHSEIVQSATELATSTSQSAADAVISSTAPLLDTVGQAVDTSIVSPVQQAVDTSIVNPIQEAAGSVGTAINQALPDVPDLPKVSTPELPTLPNLPSMPDIDPSITIGGVTIF